MKRSQKTSSTSAARGRKTGPPKAPTSGVSQPNVPSAIPVGQTFVRNFYSMILIVLV